MSAPETVLPPDVMETDITGETDLVGNGEFLLAVFGDDLAGARPVVVSFEGNPASVPPKVWFGSPWRGTPDLAVSLPASANNYFSLGIFRPDEAGQFRRQKKDVLFVSRGRRRNFDVLGFGRGFRGRP